MREAELSHQSWGRIYRHFPQTKAERAEERRGENFRRRGIGRAMVTRALAWLAVWRAEPIVVAVLAGNDEAARLYEQFGFKSRTIWLQQPSVQE